MQRNRVFLLPLLLVLPLLLGPATAWAQGPPPSSFTLSWSALDPGNDWTAQIIQSVFPIAGSASASYATGNEATVIGSLVGTLTGFVAAIAMAFLCYATIMQIHRGAETGRVLANTMTTMFIVRLGMAAVLMYPLSTGFSAGQELVVRSALWGAGMARTVYNAAVTAIGPDAMVIADPIIPGTKTIVSNLIQAEMCRALINQAAAQPALVPAPTPATVVDPVNGGYTTWAYTLSAGNSTGSPVCGTVTVREPKAGATTFSGVNLDMASQQKAILTNVLTADIRPTVEVIAQQFWTTKQAAALTPLMDVLTTATTDYTQQLTAAASAKAAELRAALSDATQARSGNLGLIRNEVQLSSLGWSSAGAYFLEFARLNGEVLSLMSAVPTVNTPSYQGLGPSLASDIAPLIVSQQAFLTKLNTYVQTTDGLDAPGGNADLFTGAVPASDGSATIESVFRNLRLNDRVLNLFVAGMAPTGNNWTDPFSALMQLGHQMVVVALAALGAAGLLASDTASTVGAIGSFFTGNWGGAAAITVGHLMMTFLATPIFVGLMGILIPGLTLAFVLPMIPWVMWMAGVTGWLILVCEAVIAVPLWMLAHMTMQGDGLHGRATEGYSLLFNVLFRPTLMIVGLFLGYFIFAASSWLIRMSFGIAAGFVLQNGWLVTNVIGVVVMLSIFVTIHIVAALQSFRMISLVPHHLPRLIGFMSGGRVDMEQYSRDAALVGIGGTMREIKKGAYAALPRQQRSAQSIEQPQMRVGGPTNHQQSSSDGNNPTGHGMDSTLRAATDNPGTGRSEEA